MYVGVDMCACVLHSCKYEVKVGVHTVFQAEEKLQKQEEDKRQKLAAQRLAEVEKASSANGTGGTKKKAKHKEEKQQKALITGGSNSPQVDLLKGMEVKAVSKGKQRLKEGQPENQAERIGGSPEEVPVSNGKSAGVRQDVAKVSAPVTKATPEMMSSTRTSSKDMKKSAEVFQPPAHLMKSLAEQTLQQAASKVSVTSPLMTSSAPLPTLGGQPNSPTAKKAKRRLAPAGAQGTLPAQRKLLLQQPPPDLQQLEIQRKMEAKQDVAKQMKEAEEFARQQTHLRQMQQAQLMQRQKEEQLQQQKALQENKQLQQHIQLKQQQQVLQPSQQQQLKLQQQKQQHLVQAKPPTAGKPSPVAPHQTKMAANGVAGQHLSGTTNHGKLVNGVSVASRPPQTMGPTTSSTGPAAGQAKLVSGSNGLTNQTQVGLSAENRARIATMAQHQEQTEQVISSLIFCLLLACLVISPATRECLLALASLWIDVFRTCCAYNYLWTNTVVPFSMAVTFI